MAKRLLHAFLVTVMTTALVCQCYDSPDDSPLAVRQWFGKIRFARPITRRIHFFLHDVKSGPGATTYPIAQASITASSSTSFGLQHVIDSPLTVGPDPNSKVIGYLQGVFTYASQEVKGDLLVVDNFVFTDGVLNGSTLAILGRKRLPTRYREYSIVGGTGLFRLARGIVTDNPYPVGTTESSPPVEVQVIIQYYDAYGLSESVDFI